MAYLVFWPPPLSSPPPFVSASRALSLPRAPLPAGSSQRRHGCGEERKAAGRRQSNLGESYPLVICYIAIETGTCSSLIYLLKIVIFHSYVSLPEGTAKNPTWADEISMFSGSIFFELTLGSSNSKEFPALVMEV
jgi:hypothetical protein